MAALWPSTNFWPIKEIGTGSSCEEPLDASFGGLLFFFLLMSHLSLNEKDLCESLD
jgi:hypothetical protein